MATDTATYRYADAVAAGYAWLCHDCAHVAEGMAPGWALPADAVIYGRLYSDWTPALVSDARGRCQACNAPTGGLSHIGSQRFDISPASPATAPEILPHAQAAWLLAEADARQDATAYAARQAATGATEPTEAPLSGEWAGTETLARDIQDAAARVYGWEDLYSWTTYAPEAEAATADGVASDILDAWEDAYATAPAWPAIDTATACQCEAEECTHTYMRATAGSRRAQHVGRVCDTCATGCLAAYLLPTA